MSAILANNAGRTPSDKFSRSRQRPAELDKSKQPELVFLFRSHRHVEPRILPLAIRFIPVKLLRLHSCGTFEILPHQLLKGTRYLKFVEELVFNYTLLSQLNQLGLHLKVQTLHSTLERRGLCFYFCNDSFWADALLHVKKALLFSNPRERVSFCG